MFKYGYFIIVFLSILFHSCVEIKSGHNALPPGIWRATLELDRVPYAGAEDQMSTHFEEGDIIAFLMNVVYVHPDSFYIEIINGEERILVSDIVYGLDRATAKDTIIIDFPVYDTYIHAIYEENIIEGYWHVNYRDSYRIPFKAYQGQNSLYTNSNPKPEADFSGRWAVTFTEEDGTEFDAVGIFEQNGMDISGTFLTETGDYRFLYGQVIRNKLYMGTFDGSHAYYFNAKMNEDGSVNGVFRSGIHYRANWTGMKDENAALQDAFSLTEYSTGQKMAFSLPNSKGDLISPEDSVYQGKIKLIQIMGTWCPNCMDESQFLIDFITSEEPGDIEVISIAFEQYRDEEKALKAIEKFKQKMNVPYEVLLGGHKNKDEVSQSFSSISAFRAFPTLIFVNQHNEIMYIHTGFNGPATPVYEQFKIDFHRIIAEMRSEL